MSLPLAYLLTCTAYGQRLHGDERGSVDRDHNQRGTPVLPTDDTRQRAERALMAGPVVCFSPAMRTIIDGAIVELAAERAWHLLARNVRMTHLHIVVNCRGTLPPEAALGQFKSRATRRLRLAGLLPAAGSVWTRHGSTRWLNHYAGLYGAIAYVNEWQTGPHREILEGRRRAIRAQIEEMRAWLRASGLPEDGKGVVVGETAEERRARLRPWEEGLRESEASR